jgi:hypothetical protein
MRITSITTEYSLDEDRIRLAVADKDKNACTLWMTRRLSERMVPALVQSLQKQMADPKAEPAAAQAAQVYAQLEARLNKKPVKQVPAPNAATQKVITELKIKTGENGVRVIEFHNGVTGEPAILVMRTAEMRQWLEVLRQAFVKGQWREDIWPQWLK